MIRNPISLEDFFYHYHTNKNWKLFFRKYWRKSILQWNSDQKSRWFCPLTNQRIMLTKILSYRSLRLFPLLLKNYNKTFSPIFFLFAALLRIPWDLKLLKIAPICLPLSAKSRNETFLGINCMATGWGQTQMKGTMSWNCFLRSLFHLCNFYLFVC